MEAMNLEILRLHPMQNYGTPYDYDVDGFNENGWHSSFIIETTKQQEENDYWSFYQPRKGGTNQRSSTNWSHDPLLVYDTRQKSPLII